MTGTLIYLDAQGASWSVLNRDITFSGERGLKQAITRAIRKDYENGNLNRFYGYNTNIRVEVWRDGYNDAPVATTSVNL